MGRAEREHLPEGNTARGEPVDEGMGLLAERAFWKRGGMEQDACPPVGQHVGFDTLHHPACPVRMTPPIDGAP